MELNVLQEFEVCILFSQLEDDLQSFVEETVIRNGNYADGKIVLSDLEDCYSAEWPAVIVLHELKGYLGDYNLSQLYLEISRARVFCSVLVVPEKDHTVTEYKDMHELLNRLESVTHIIRYCDE